MQATFGKLQNKTLELSDGLNIIEAPNETGKSTWCAFLTSMLYGINSRDRDRADHIADKNRYTPWSGTPMSGRMDLTIGQREVTLTRTNSRAGAPLSELRAVWSGTNDAIPGITAQNCGDAVVGIPREIFERSAFIRQSGLPLNQDPELEKRIAALISSGEEDTSFSEAMEALKKQQNRRRHNKTGEIPALEAEIQEHEAQLNSFGELDYQLERAKREVVRQEQLLADLESELDGCVRWEQRDQLQTLEDAEAQASQARARAESIRRKLNEAHVPEVHDIGRLRGALVNIQSTRKNVEKAREARDEAMKAVLRAEAPVNDSPFAGQSAESAQRELQKEAPKASPLFTVLLILSLAGIAGSLFANFGAQLLTGTPFYMVLGLCSGVAAVSLVTMLRASSAQSSRKTVLMRRFGTDDPAAIQKMAEEYAANLSALEGAQAILQEKTATADSLYAALTSNEQAILLELRRFVPDAHDLSTADNLLRQCAALRKQQAEAEALARDAVVRRDVLGDQIAPDAPELPDQSPAREKAAVEADVRKAKEQLAQAQSNADRLTGQLQALGDPVVIRSETELLKNRLAQLESEYEALDMAMAALDSANTTLQTRFSPALGRRTAEIFRELTGAHYQSVALDRELHLTVQPEGDHLQRDAKLLSCGALDQLYLAARLAICEMVLPPDREIPLILDDALTNFDDQRCASVLNWLKKASEKRQVILFTCHSREAAFFKGNCEVSVQRLTEHD